MRLLLLVVLAALASCRAKESGPPDRVVVIVLVDTLRADSLSCYGGANPTPSIDALASEGVRFDAAIASSGWTLPSVASLLTGTSPRIHKALGKGTGLTPISAPLETGAERLRDKGFYTVALTNAAFVNPLLGLTRGFDEVSHEHAYNDSIRRADETVDVALAALAEHEGRDTFCLLHLFDAHLAYDPPEGWRPEPSNGSGAFRTLRWQDCTSLKAGRVGEHPPREHVKRVRAAYDAEVRFVDAMVGRLVAGMRALGLYDQATLVVTSDHGEEFWEHAGFEHGHSLYDELVRVPLILRLPGGPAGVARGEQVRLVDVMPTLFDELGVEPLETFEGRSLLPLLAGEDTAPRPALSEGTLYGHDKSALRDGRFKFIVDRNPKAAVREELYDVLADPAESKNLLTERPDVASRMRVELATLIAEQETLGVGFPPQEVLDLAPSKRAEIMRQLEDLGYTDPDD
jgi:arylsulfatase A-like enzyme